jgi:iron complex outermembrane receptor protein
LRLTGEGLEVTMKLFRNTLLGATILMGIGTTPGLAQDAAPAGDGAGKDSNEIVVTATRRAVSLKDVPINISAVSQEQLSRQRIDDVRGLAAFTPGVTAVDTGPGSTGNIILRGINSGDTSDGGASTNDSIGVYLGEVPLYLDFKFIDISRVEVLEGPQGTLYGLGTLAGAVRYIPNRPNTDRFSVDLHARGYAESHSDDFGGSGDVTINIPIVKDHIAFRTATGYYDNAGFIDYNYLLNTPGVSDPQPVRGATAAEGSFGTQTDYAANFHRAKDVNYEHTFTTRNQLLLEYNPGIKAYLTFARQTTKTLGRQSNGAGVLGTGNYEGPWRYLEPSDRKANLYSAEVYLNLFNIAQLVSTTAYTEETLTTKDDNTDLLLDLNYGYEAFPEFSSYAINSRKLKQFNQEVRLVSTHGGPVSWVIGGFYNDQKAVPNLLGGTLNRIETTPGFSANGTERPDDAEYISFSRTKTVEKAVYGEATVHFTKAWQVTGGIRYFKYDAESSGGSDTPNFGGGITRTPYPLLQVTRVRSAGTGADGVVWKANTSYKFNDDLLVYGTYSTGYRTGNVNRVAPCILPLPAGQNVCALPDELSYGPDKTKNAEIGVRASLFDRRLQFTLDGFRINWSGIQVPSTTINGAISITKNGGKAISQGLEFSGLVKITPELVVQGTYAYTDAHLTSEAPNLVVVQDPQETIAGEPGDRLPGSTKNSGSIQATYTHSLGNGRTIIANWATTYTGSIYSRVGLRGFGTKIPGYVTHRASLTYSADKFDVSLFADNIFDKYAVTSVGNDQSSLYRVRDVFGDSPELGVVERFYGQSVLTPRRVGVEFNYHY